MTGTGQQFGLFNSVSREAIAVKIENCGKAINAKPNKQSYAVDAAADHHHG
jgi:hypothetical protein